MEKIFECEIGDDRTNKRNECEKEKSTFFTEVEKDEKQTRKHRQDFRTRERTDDNHRSVKTRMPKSAEKIRLLYGGSIHSKFAEQVCLDPAMDGGLVGRESLMPYEFVKIASLIDQA